MYNIVTSEAFCRSSEKWLEWSEVSVKDSVDICNSTATILASIGKEFNSLIARLPLDQQREITMEDVYRARRIASRAPAIDPIHFIYNWWVGNLGMFTINGVSISKATIDDARTVHNEPLVAHRVVQGWMCKNVREFKKNAFSLFLKQTSDSNNLDKLSSSGYSPVDYDVVEEIWNVLGDDFIYDTILSQYLGNNKKSVTRAFTSDIAVTRVG